GTRSLGGVGSIHRDGVARTRGTRKYSARHRFARSRGHSDRTASGRIRYNGFGECLAVAVGCIVHRRSSEPILKGIGRVVGRLLGGVGNKTRWTVPIVALVTTIVAALVGLNVAATVALRTCH